MEKLIYSSVADKVGDVNLTDLLSIGILPVSSAVVFKPSFIGIDNNISNLIGNARV